MKKILIGFVGVFVGAAVAVAVMMYVLPKTNAENENANSNTSAKETDSNTQNQNDNNSNGQNQNGSTNTQNQNTNNQQNTNTNNTQQQNNGYEIMVSKKELTINKGSSVSFDITYTNPDESSIREYIHCNDQNNIVVVKYSDINDKKINVEVEGLKAGTTEIEVSDYNYPNKKEIVKVTVVE